MSEENKTKFALWLSPQVKSLVTDMYERDNCRSRSEFIEKAIRFYAGYMSSAESSEFLSRTLVSSIRGTLDDSENRISRLLFKLAVELSLTMHIVAAGKGIGDIPLAKLRSKCVGDVRKSIGSVDMEKIDEYQNGA